MYLEQRNPDCKNVLDVILANRGITAKEFFDEEIKEYNIDNIHKASKKITEAVFDGKTITIVGDYDADGITSSSILFTAIQTLGATPVVRLPRRFSEGYGLSEKIIDEINSGLLITVDNGITAYDAVKKAKDKGLEVIIVDHHLGPEDGILPPADIVIDPNAIENSADFNSYCGAGLSYKLASAMLPNHPVLKKLVSLAAVGTIADVMPLIEDNRNIVREGLSNMVKDGGSTAGLYALLNEVALEYKLNAKNIAFKIGPILNAPGRLKDDGAMDAFRLLTFDGNAYKAADMAKELVAMNEKRKELVSNYTAQIEKIIKKGNMENDSVLTIYVPSSSADQIEGLVGIFAGRIAENYGVPCICLTDSEDPEVLKGSARSNAGVHLKNLFDEHAELFVKYGGHAEAAGLSIRKADLDIFRKTMNDSVSIERVEDDTVYYDLEIKESEVGKLIEDIEKYGPFGEGNPEIVCLVKDIKLYPITMGDSEFNGLAKTMGENKQHIKFAAKDFDIVCFDATDSYRQMGTPRTIDVVGCFSQNAWHRKVTKQCEAIMFDAVEEKQEMTEMASLLAKMANSR